MHYKHLQYNNYGPALELSDAARRALKGEMVRSWPHGDPASGPTWSDMFDVYSKRYE